MYKQKQNKNEVIQKAKTHNTKLKAQYKTQQNKS